MSTSLPCSDSSALICHYLSVPEIAIFGSLCTRFHKYVTDRSDIWMHSTITESEVHSLTTFGTKKIRSMIRRIVPDRVRLHHYAYPPIDWLWIFQEYSSLERVECGISFQPSSAFWRAFSSPCRVPCPKLQSIYLRQLTDIQLGDERYLVPVRWSIALTAFPSLTELHVSQLTLFGELTECLSSHLPHLRVLSARSIQFPERCWTPSTDPSLCMFPHLHSLRVSAVPQNLQVIMSEVMKRHMPRVTELYLNRWDAFVWKLNDLKMLQVHERRCALDIVFDMPCVSDTNVLFPHLRVLSMTTSGSHISTMLKHCPSLEILDLNLLTYAKPIPKLICALSRLESLSLQSLSVSRDVHIEEHSHPCLELLMDLCSFIGGHPHMKRMIEEQQRNYQAYLKVVQSTVQRNHTHNTHTPHRHRPPFQLKHLRVPMHPASIELLQTPVCHGSLQCLEVQLIPLHQCLSSAYEPFASSESSDYMSYSEVINGNPYQMNGRTVIPCIPRLIVRQRKYIASLAEIDQLVSLVSSFGVVERYGEDIGGLIEEVGDDGFKSNNVLRICMDRGALMVADLNESTPVSVSYAEKDHLWSKNLNHGLSADHWKQTPNTAVTDNDWLTYDRFYPLDVQ